MRSGIFAGLLLATVSAAAAFAQGAPIKLANVAELSGGGATVGNNWKNGIDLAIEEINAKGGLLGRKLEVTHADSQSNPGVARAQVQKALDGKPYVLLGPGYSGSVKVTFPKTGKFGYVKVPTVFGLAHQAGFTTAAIFSKTLTARPAPFCKIVVAWRRASRRCSA